MKKLLFLAASLTLALAAFCQDLGTAGLTGAVADPSGAMVSGAQITVHSNANGTERHTTTTSAGIFVVAELAPGDYELTVNSSGFAQSKTTVHLVVGQQANVRLNLHVGNQEQKIQVSDEAPLVQTNSSVVDGIIDAKAIDSLPLNGRNFLELALLMPGNSPAPLFDPTKSDTVLVSSAGQLGRGQNVTIDGGDDNDDVVGGMLLNLPEDAVQEFQIATNRFDASLGRSTSSVVNVVSKQGTNELHGTAALFARDKALQANPDNFGHPQTETPPFRREQYTGSIGGALVKDRAWWFTSFEYRDQMGGILVGQRDLASHSITTGFAEAPLTDLLGTGRVDWQLSPKDTVTSRYSIERFDGTSNSATDRAIGSDGEVQDSVNHFQDITTSWTRVISPTMLNRARFSVNLFQNNTNGTDQGPQIDFPSIETGSSYRVPQQTRQRRFQFGDTVDWTKGKHNFKIGAEFQRVGADFNLGVFQSGFVQAVEDFPDFDRNKDGVVNDADVLFAVGLISHTPTRPLIIPDADNNYIATFIQDDWHIHRQLTLNLGLRYELDTDVKNVGHYDQVNPIAKPFLVGSRHPDYHNFGPRVGFNWANASGKLSVHGGYGIYYDRITLEIDSLERGEDGRALAIDVHAGNVLSDPSTGIPIFLAPDGTFADPAHTPTLLNPFSAFIIPGAGAGGIYIIDNKMQNPMVQQFNVGVQYQFANNWVVRADGLHDLGTHFIIGVPIATVFNPVVGGPDTVKDLQSSVNTHYDALLLTVDHPFSQRFAFHSAYTLSKSMNYANDDQIPFANGPIDPTDLHREYGPTPNDQRNRLVLAGTVALPWGLQLSPLWTIASAVPMDILLPDGGSRIPEIQRNAGGREFHSAADLNAFITNLNAAGGVNGDPLPLVGPNAKFGDMFSSFDARLSKTFKFGERTSFEVMAECFNLANRTNVLGISNTNYSGYNNVLVRDNNDPSKPGYLHSSAFGQPVTTAGGIFGSGGPRAFQFAARFSF
jgi:hypothetical protein